MSRRAPLQILLPTLLSMMASPASADPSTAWRTKQNETRQFARKDAAREIQDYTHCIAVKDYARASMLAVAPYSSQEQNDAVKNLVIRRDDPCLLGTMEGISMKFTMDIFAGGIAQALVVKDYPDLSALVGAFHPDPADESSRLRGLTGAEAFGRCVVQRDPSAAFALFSSRAATPREQQAINALRDDLSPCLAAGSTIKINGMFLRNSMGAAAYRLAQQIQPRGPAGKAIQ